MRDDRRTLEKQRDGSVVISRSHPSSDAMTFESPATFSHSPGRRRS